MPWKTMAHWPGVAGLPDNRSSDEHETLALAGGVRRDLLAFGLGRDGKIFPTKVEVEAVGSPVCECDTWYRSGGHLAEPAEDRVLDAVDEMTMNHSRAPHWQSMRR